MSELRRRGAPKSIDNESGPSTLVQRLKTFDMYAKVEEDYKVQTSTGGAVSLITLTVVAVLFLNELGSFLTVRSVEHVTVDSKIDELIKINFNITFPALKCGACMVDVMDVAGEQQVNVDHNIVKQRIGPDGSHIGAAYLDHHKVEPHVHMQELFPGLPIMVQQPAMGDGHEGHDHDHGHKEEAPPGVDEVTGKDPSQDGEGCIVAGLLVVNKVSGNFHFALGSSHKSGGHHVHHFMLSEAESFNNSHIINSLSFGDAVAGMVNPLDGVSRILDAHSRSGNFQYFLKVVPTAHTDLANTTVKTNQYSVTQQWKAVDLMRNRGGNKIPGVFFLYDLAPFSVTITDTRTPFSQFLISVCVIIGGAVTMASLIDQVLYHSASWVNQQLKQGAALAQGGGMGPGLSPFLSPSPSASPSPPSSLSSPAPSPSPPAPAIGVLKPPPGLAPPSAHPHTSSSAAPTPTQRTAPDPASRASKDE